MKNMLLFTAIGFLFVSPAMSAGFEQDRINAAAQQARLAAQQNQFRIEQERQKALDAARARAASQRMVRR